MNDVVAAWPVIICSILVAFIFGYMFLLFLQCFGGCIIWLAFIACVVCAAGAGVYAYQLSEDPSYLDDPTADYLKYSAYGLWIMAAIFVLILLCCYSQLKLGIAVFSTTVDFTKANCIIFLLPTLGMIMQLIWFLVWIVSFVMVFSVGEVTQRESPLQFLTEIMWEDKTRYVLII